MQKWEYCLLKQYTEHEVWLYKSNGEKVKLKGDEYTLATMLDQLGGQGWEAVNYLAIFDAMGRPYLSWHFSTWPIATQVQILFKRPKE